MSVVAPAKISVGLLGAAPDTGNRGVSALGLSLCSGLSAVSPDFAVTVFDFGREIKETYAEQLGGDVTVDRLPCYRTKRFFSPASHAQIALATKLGMGGFQPTIKKIRKMRALLDVSGGDSFSDIYGQFRFDSIVGDKMLAISQGRPLILLPQTYGPFLTEKNRETASRVVREAKAVWARDERSLSIVRDLLGDHFDPERHKSTVDMAFGLPVVQPEESIAKGIQDFASAADVLVGLNVSGLLYQSPTGGVEDFKFLSSYREVIESLFRELLAQPGVRILLVGHVGPNQFSEESAGSESDTSAMRSLLETVKVDDPDRAYLVPHYLNALQLKWAIGQCDWFCGTRMHSCIAGLSQGVPTGAIAYSDKTIGVFETASVGESVIDPRVDDAETVVRKLIESFHQRDTTRETLRQWLPVVKGRLKDFFETLKTQIG
ncbi:polysaccharide pyruvyl transferase family protein [Bremerella cremea]|uniref:Polysaccharide pyruvyl transferase domain-containing protein n=1 Tax=Blastopirellula marina TaxID=124 RepID=A0A2S8FL03_9BACT|nr:MULTISPECIES: polysaccharide pyruvyl transferase family protein [Pirellulaceae]PQO32843.1 hypothetical protein C5Y83_21920 [Blastopirellula marina]RCS45910.1 polysaccharide pyruvyl transferase family protein [Bremerella cremea]